MMFEEMEVILMKQQKTKHGKVGLETACFPVLQDLGIVSRALPVSPGCLKTT